MFPPELSREWVRAGTGFFGKQWDADLARPTALPGWTRAHVVGHIARNAEALTRLATWARTGIEMPMYGGPAQRDEDIELSARFPAAKLRQDVWTTTAELDEALDSLDAETWAATVRTAQGRLVSATEIPWLRVREVWLHAVDLGASISELPPDVVDALLDDISRTRGRGLPHGLLLRPVDRDRTWQVPGADPVTISGAAADLLAWLTGRGHGETLDGDLPTLPPWL
jgi:maleylpyruvate isomerase